MGFLAGFLAAELDENIKDAKRAAFLHDIGKVLMDPEAGLGGHAVVGAEFALKHGEKKNMTDGIGAHHDEYKPESILDFLVKAADALSGGRPGARIESVESYFDRIEELTEIANSYKGVFQSYAMHAGRELRVHVDSSVVGDDHTHVLSKAIAERIQKELVFPGQIKVLVIRESRATDTAS